MPFEGQRLDAIFEFVQVGQLGLLPVPVLALQGLTRVVWAGVCDSLACLPPMLCTGAVLPVPVCNKFERKEKISVGRKDTLNCGSYRYSKEIAISITNACPRLPLIQNESKAIAFTIINAC